ncbi:MAG TPA: hypothetical protein VKH36_05090 [Acidimicrobiia bacterium]|nr:hypothetical protein [Acidimicrobiia bacterium]
MAGALRRPGESGHDHVAEACLESMLLHARNLGEFLIEGRYKTSDIHRSDFAPGWSPPNSPAKRRLRDARPMLDRHLSHLSWERVEEGEPDHDQKRIADDMVEVMGTFVDHLDAVASPAAEWFDGQLRRARDLLAGDAAGVGVVSDDTGDAAELTDTGNGAVGRAIPLPQLPSIPAVALRVGGPAVAIARRTWGLVAAALSRLGDSLQELRHRDHA